MSKAVYICPKCGNDWYYDDTVASPTCNKCYSAMLITDIDLSEHVSKTYNTETARKYKSWEFENYVLPHGKFDPIVGADLLYTIGRLNDSEYSNIKLQKQIVETQHKAQSTYNNMSNNVPKCPTCGSNNLQKISAANKVGSVALFGIFAAGHVNKTWKCLNCGSKF